MFNDTVTFSNPHLVSGALHMRPHLLPGSTRWGRWSYTFYSSWREAGSPLAPSTTTTPVSPHPARSPPTFSPLLVPAPTRRNTELPLMRTLRKHRTAPFRCPPPAAWQSHRSTGSCGHWHHLCLHPMERVCFVLIPSPNTSPPGPA